MAHRLKITTADGRPDGSRRCLLSRDEWRAIVDLLGLSQREFQIVQGIFDGEEETGIARELGISTNTVHSHIKRLYRKLSVSNHSEVVVRIFEAYLGVDSAVPLALDGPR